MKARSDLLIVVIFLGIISAILSYGFARFIALRLVARLQRLNTQIKNNLHRSDKVEPLEITGSDELTELSKSFNELMDTREKFRKEHIEMERVQAQTKRREELAQVAAQVSHDIKPPLETLLTMLRESKKLSEEKRNEMIRSVVTRIEQISGDLIRGKSHKDVRNSSTFVAPVIKSIVDEKMISLGNDESISIHTNLGSSSGTDEIPIAPTSFARALSNLIDNSIRSIRERGANGNIWIRIDSSSSDGFLKIEVKDDGIGMDAETLEKVRAGAGSFDGGSGLGLSFVRNSLVSVEGRIEIQSQKNSGTSVSLFIPILNQSKQISKTWPPDLILIDNDELVKDNWMLEAEMAGVNLLCVSDPEDVPWDKLPKDIPIYVDKNLGNRSGLDVYQYILKMGFEKIILCSAESTAALPPFVREFSGKEFPKNITVRQETRI